jgi:hypothetical protein
MLIVPLPSIKLVKDWYLGDVCKGGSESLGNINLATIKPTFL